MAPKTALLDVADMPNRLPEHLAIIMDGNQRWAREQRLSCAAGHRAGADNVRRVAKICVETGVRYLTLFAFSTENWRRPPKEISLLMKLLKTVLQADINELHDAGIKLRIIGDRARFSAEVQSLMDYAERLTQDNTQMDMQLAVNYGGRWDMVTTMKTIAEVLARGDLAPGDIDEKLVERFTALAGVPPLDLCIRTGGEHRLSNFLLWDLAYAELYFTPTYWPDFDASALQQALSVFSDRDRRYGRH